MRILTRLVLVAALLTAVVWVLSRSAPFLVIDQPRKSDAIVVLIPDDHMLRYSRAIQLMEQGYSNRIILDALRANLIYGQSDQERAEAFVSRLPAALRDRISVCGTSGDSTAEELSGIQPCLEGLGAHKVLLVTHDFHTRRALDTARKVLPGFDWSVAAAPTLVSNRDWWRSRWAVKYVFLEYQKLAWWNLVERHTSRSTP